MLLLLLKSYYKLIKKSVKSGAISIHRGLLNNETLHQHLILPILAYGCELRISPHWMVNPPLVLELVAECFFIQSLMTEVIEYQKRNFNWQSAPEFLRKSLTNTAGAAFQIINNVVSSEAPDISKENV